ncbi:alkaline phosphatase family protein [Geminisphaera colitermitum]|uniref:alkaline phosphatase family protein n=1 Tax=Geminisphaera colitermitum TaxID=1148786 RepID=UPI000158C53C|nr:alkaline phosphatase family protein [Geminisphaera colitermitum]
MKPKPHALLAVFAGCCLSFAVALTAASAPESTAPRAEHVFIISFDQGSPAGIEKADMPLFKQMAADGAHTWEACTIVPSITLPSHTSMLTGVGIQKHQILWNDIWAPAKPQLTIPTIFNLAKKSGGRGLVTAAYVSKQKFRLFEYRGDIDRFSLPADTSSLGVAASFAEDVASLKPNLCFIHFGEPDAMGHRHGIWSPEKMKAFADSDAALKIIRDAITAAGIADTSVIIMTADHGCHDTKNKEGKTVGTHGSASPDDVIIPWVAWGRGVKPGFTITAPVVQYDTAATALWLLGVEVPESFWGRPVTSAFE